ncbi:hypothetical protein ACWC0A_37850 [Streptomyces scopuliridis]
MSNDFRETKLRIFGVERVIRTERTGSVKQLEAAHTKAVKAVLAEERTVGLDRRHADRLDEIESSSWEDKEGWKGSGRHAKANALALADKLDKERRAVKHAPVRCNWVDACKGLPKVTYGKPVPDYLIEIAPREYATTEAARSMEAEELPDEVLPGLELRRYGKKWVLCHVLSVTEERPNVHIGPVFKTRERARHIALTELAHLDWTHTTEELLADPVAGPTVRIIKWREFVAASKRNAWAKERVREAEAELAVLTQTLAA